MPPIPVTQAAHVMDDARTIDHTINQTPRMCVVASGSAGNCTVLVISSGGRRQVCLIDAGLSPRRTLVSLRRLGLTPDELTDVIVTHLDHDHFHGGWRAKLPDHTTIRMHRRHLGRAARDGLLHRRTIPFDSDFTIGEETRVSTALLDHDSLGVVCFRFDFGPGASTLGFATDVGRPTPRMLEHLKGVDVLAIESNYCPKMQAVSPRPEFLKSRIMGGAGHLSNAQCVQAVQAIGPRHAVLLHLSRDCNLPELALAGHQTAGYAVTVSSQTAPTPWIDLTGMPRNRDDHHAGNPDIRRTRPAVTIVQPSLFAW